VFLVLQNNIKCMDNAGDVAKDGEQDVDQKVSAAATLEEDTKRREDNGDDDLQDVASSESHLD